MTTLKFFHFTVFLAILSICVQSQELTNSRKLEGETPPDVQNKCGSCPCNNPCNPPPLPSPPPPSPPPPAPKKPTPKPSNYCPPPPPSGGGGGGGGGGQSPPNPPYIYINGPPGDLYPVDQFYSGSGRSYSTGLLPLLISSGLVVIAFW